MGQAAGVEEGTALVALAERARRLAHADPDRARRMAERLVARAADDPEARSLAQEALGSAAQQRQDLADAVAHLRMAVEIAQDAGLPERAAQARTGLCHALLARGEPHAALAEADRAVGVLRGPDAARLLTRRASVLQRLGQLDEALSAYSRALPVLRRAGDREWEARTLTNRGILHAYRSEHAAAERDLERAERIYRDLGQLLSSAQVRHNLGFVAARRGDVPAALRAYDAAERYYRRLGMTDPVGLADRCALSVSARLLPEAADLAARAVDELARGHMDSDLAEARLTLANVHLLAGDAAAAREAAEQALADFQRQRRPAWAVLARYAALQADWRAGVCTPAFLRRARRVAGALADSGWHSAAIDARLLAARTALRLGRVTAAERELAVHPTARTRGPVEVRARAWHAEALLRLAHGNRRGADAALRAGMRALERHRATLGATELRVHVAGHVGELAALGLRLALESGSPRRALAWAERWRAGALTVAPVRPPDDAALAADLEALRDTTAQLDEAALAGADTRPHVRRQVALEREIQRRSRHASGPIADGARSFDVHDLLGRLGERVLVEMLRLGDELWAVVARDGRLRLQRLGAHEDAVAELDHLRFAVRRLALSGAAGDGRERAEDALAYAAGRLDEQLLVPVRGDLGERPLVVVPTGALHALPWGLLPSCRRRPVTVAPSAQLWSRAATGGAAGDGVVLVGCATPPQAVEEVRALQRQYPRARTLLGGDATVAAVTAALDGARIAHLACHGRFRADNPLFSSLELADGPLTVFDLERRRRAPSTLLLSACESGLSGVQPGDELMGLSSALFALGTSALIASVAPVPDAATRRVMPRVHDELRRGQPPAAALAHAVAAAEDGDRVAAASFVCFGAG